jgi:hypothetical protein
VFGGGSCTPICILLGDEIDPTWIDLMEINNVTLNFGSVWVVLHMNVSIVVLDGI